MCYANASAYSENHGLTYVEGYGLTNIGNVGFACAHAWCVDEHGNVHDPTWRDGLGIAYLGIPFSRNYIQEIDERLGNACLLHDSHLDGHRILRDGLPADAIRPVGEQVVTLA